MILGIHYTMKNAPITVIITTYNDSEYLAAAINSVISQTLLPAQLIIVDDGSDDNNACKITSKYLNNDSGIEVTYFKKKNGGASSARNLGLKHVSEEFVTFLDADDQMLSNNLLDKFDAIKDLNNDYFGVYSSNMTSKRVKDSFTSIDGLANTSQVGKAVEGIPGGSCSYLFRYKNLKKIGGYDENLHNNEDHDLIIRLIKDNKKCKGIDSCGILIFKRNNSLSRGGDTKKRFYNSMVFINKAEDKGYFDKEELLLRKKAVYLVYIRSIILKNPIEALAYANTAFSYSGPENKKQKAICFLSKITKLRVLEHK